MRISRRQLRQLIKEERASVLREADFRRRAEAKAERAMNELLAVYIDEYSDLSGSNREDAILRAVDALKSFAKRTIALGRDFERDPQSYT